MPAKPMRPASVRGNRRDGSPEELLAEIRKRLPRERGPGGRPRKNGTDSKAFVPSLAAQVKEVRSE